MTQSKIFVGMPTLGSCRVEHNLNMLYWSSKYVTGFATSNLGPLSEARNELVRTFLSSEAGYLLFIDSDTVMQPNGLDLLLLDNKDVVSAAYPFPFKDGEKVSVATCAFKNTEGEFFKPYALTPELVKVDSVGMGACLIKRDVFDKIDYPYFSGHVEDFYFCKKLRDAGVEIYLNGRVKATHYKELALNL